jgi:hypothetical protein
MFSYIDFTLFEDVFSTSLVIYYSGIQPGVREDILGGT